MKLHLTKYLGLFFLGAFTTTITSIAWSLDGDLSQSKSESKVSQ